MDVLHSSERARLTRRDPMNMNPLATSFVQQLCSNPSKYPEMLRNVSTQEFGCFREYCSFQKPPATYRTAFTWQRLLVQTQHRPL